ncbi:MAG: winged helix-turn-helix domain-containing protein [Chloroflexi bacterium]|nr:winged helix-turn-helix domain-containing protein [Chloroflexota bacterium]
MSDLQAVLTNHAITDGAARVGAYLTLLPGATIREIARDLGISEGAAKRRREELRKQGWSPGGAAPGETPQ